MTEHVDALVPVKDFALAKERLAPLLSPDERRELAVAMFRDVIDALRAAPSVRRVWVVSGAAEVLRLAKELGAMPVPEPAPGGLNGALEFARSAAMETDKPPAALLVIPADVPGTTPAAITHLISVPLKKPLVRIVAAADGGTNALLLVPPGAIPFRYGLGSARRHAEEAAARGIWCDQVSLVELDIDLDTPADVRGWLATAPTGRTADLLRRVAIG